MSDGELLPADVVKRAVAMGVDVLALTDHDTVAGVAEAQIAARDLPLALIPGIEVSAQWRGRTVHVVGLNIDIGSSSLIAALDNLQLLRKTRAQQIAARLEKIGVKNALAGAESYAGDSVIGRPHFAAHMVASGFVKSSAQAFKRYLGAGKVGDVRNVWPELSEAVAWIVGAGGLAVLAHPEKYKLTRTKLRELLADFSGAGGGAIEVVSGRQEPRITKVLAELCNDFGLLASTGSDFHRQGQPWQELGKQSELPDICRPVWTAFGQI